MKKNHFYKLKLPELRYLRTFANYFLKQHIWQQ